MGNLTCAVESVCYERHVSEDIIATSGSMQGFRAEMEDDHTICLRLPRHPNYAFIGVYDGHSGNHSSDHLAQKLWREINWLQKITKEEVSEILQQMDIDWCRTPQHFRFSGSTIVFAIIERPVQRGKTWKVQIGWVGDSRAIAIKKGRLKELTVDQKPNNPEEKKRIELAGGSVSDNRVDGELAMSRAFGDWNLKDAKNPRVDYEKNKVVCIPEFKDIELEEGDCLLLSCDGLTEQLENSDIYNELLDLQDRHPKDADVVIDGLLRRAIKSGSKDNMTTVLVEFRQGAEFRKRDKHRARTVRPGPLMEYRRSGHFLEAYMKNIREMGLWDCPPLRKAAFLRDLKVAEAEIKGDLLPNDLAVKRSKYERRKEEVDKEIENLVTEKFENTDKPEVATWSAFGDSEFLLKPKHDDYIAFLNKEEYSDSDEKKDDQQGKMVLYSSGDLVTITDDNGHFKRECLKHGITVDGKKLSFIGNLGSVEVVDKLVAKVRFENQSGMYFPVSVLEPFSRLNKDIRETIAKACKKLSNEGSISRANWVLTTEEVCGLIAVMYPDFTKKEIRKTASRWKDEEGISLPRLYKIFGQIQEKDEEELTLVIKRLNQYF